MHKPFLRQYGIAGIAALRDPALTFCQVAVAFRGSLSASAWRLP